MVGFFFYSKIQSQRSVAFLDFEKEKKQHISNCQNCESKKYFRELPVKVFSRFGRKFSYTAKKNSLCPKNIIASANCCTAQTAPTCSNVEKNKWSSQLPLCRNFGGKNGTKKRKYKRTSLQRNIFRCIISLCTSLTPP